MAKKYIVFQIQDGWQDGDALHRGEGQVLKEGFCRGDTSDDGRESGPVAEA
jgi:hypothetical protein